MLVCVCVRVYVCVRVCVRVCACVMRACARMGSMVSVSHQGLDFHTPTSPPD